jgi:hypothetical protein
MLVVLLKVVLHLQKCILRPWDYSVSWALHLTATGVEQNVHFRPMKTDTKTDMLPLLSAGFDYYMKSRLATISTALRKIRLACSHY